MISDLLNMEIKGKANGLPTLVLVHGVAGSMHIWDPIFNELSASYQVVRLDLLGYGHSPKPRVEYTPTEHVAAIRRTLLHHGIQPPYHLAGLSMGVTLVLSFASLFPDEVASIIGIGYPYYASEAAAKRGLRHDTWAGLTIAHPAMASLIIPPTWWLGRIGVLPTHMFTKIYSPLMAHDTMLNPYRVFRSTIWNCMVHVNPEKLLGYSSAKRRLFIHGDLDKWAPAGEVQAAVATYPNTSFVHIPNAEHNLVVLEPAKTLSLMLDFLES